MLNIVEFIEELFEFRQFLFLLKAQKMTQFQSNDIYSHLTKRILERKRME